MLLFSVFYMFNAVDNKSNYSTKESVIRNAMSYLIVQQRLHDRLFGLA